jgi:hypothetical protein
LALFVSRQSHRLYIGLSYCSHLECRPLIHQLVRSTCACHGELSFMWNLDCRCQRVLVYHSSFMICGVVLELADQSVTQLVQHNFRAGTLLGLPFWNWPCSSCSVSTRQADFHSTALICWQLDVAWIVLASYPKLLVFSLSIRVFELVRPCCGKIKCQSWCSTGPD